MSDRISSQDKGYVTGELSLYPVGLDDVIQLYEAKDNAATVLAQSVGYSSKWLIVDDASAFPDQGVVKLGDELIYYAKKTANTFQDLKRGFLSTRQNPWSKGIAIIFPVFSDLHNAKKDALLNIENNLVELNDILTLLENKVYAPKPIFYAQPLTGRANLQVAFQNLSLSLPVTLRYLWDFGDGTQSIEESPVHTYTSEGIFTVTLNIITSLGGQGQVTKKNYITVDNNFSTGFFYVTPQVGMSGVTSFALVDQTVGQIVSRYWIFGDGATESQLDPDIHYTSHIYSTAGTYEPNLILVFADQTLQRLTVDSIVVL